MHGSYLGPEYSQNEIVSYLDSIGAAYETMNDEDLLPEVAKLMTEENVIGWFQGRMEFGPRALGGRSIIGDARSAKMQTVMNLKIKFRESFRPFAPAVLAEKAAEWFDLQAPSPYMLMVAQVTSSKCLPLSEQEQNLFGLEQLNIPRSEIPAVTHVDYSARVQTVHRQTNPRFYRLLEEFEVLSGCPVCVNTSFNVRGEPIVNTPEDAYRCFMRTEMDYLVLENHLLKKQDQAKWDDPDNWREEFVLD